MSQDPRNKHIRTMLSENRLQWFCASNPDSLSPSGLKLDHIRAKIWCGDCRSWSCPGHCLKCLIRYVCLTHFVQFVSESACLSFRIHVSVSFRVRVSVSFRIRAFSFRILVSESAVFFSESAVLVSESVVLVSASMLLVSECACFSFRILVSESALVLVSESAVFVSESALLVSESALLVSES